MAKSNNRFRAVIVLLAVASVPLLFLAAVIVTDRLQIHVPGDILVFCAAGWMVIFGLPLSLILLLCAVASAVSIYCADQLSKSRNP